MHMGDVKGELNKTHDRTQSSQIIALPLEVKQRLVTLVSVTTTVVGNARLSDRL